MWCLCGDVGRSIRETARRLGLKTGEYFREIRHLGKFGLLCCCTVTSPRIRLRKTRKQWKIIPQINASPSKSSFE